MVGNGGVLIAALNPRRQSTDGRRAVAPFGVHLQVAAVLLRRCGPRTVGSERIRRTSARLRKCRRNARRRSISSRRSLRRSPVRLSANRPSRESRGSRASSPARSPGFSAESPSGPQQVRQRPVQREHGVGRALVTEHLLLRRLRERQVAKIPADHGIHVRIGFSRGGVTFCARHVVPFQRPVSACGAWVLLVCRIFSKATERATPGNQEEHCPRRPLKGNGGPTFGVHRHCRAKHFACRADSASHLLDRCGGQSRLKVSRWRPYDG